MFRGLIRETRALPAAEQEPLLLAAGVPNKRAIYYDDWLGALKSIRDGNRLVVCGLARLGKNRDEIEAAIEQVHAKAKAATVMDALTKRTTLGKHRKALVDEAVKALANERRGANRRGDFSWRIIVSRFGRNTSTLSRAAIRLLRFARMIADFRRATPSRSSV
jgi:hypothetical protein